MLGAHLLQMVHGEAKSLVFRPRAEVAQPGPQRKPGQHVVRLQVQVPFDGSLGLRRTVKRHEGAGVECRGVAVVRLLFEHALRDAD